jgi:carbon monoxide dehydrogenase subunit G
VRIETSSQFDAPPETVWALLMDIRRVAECLPGCERLEPIDEHRYRATLTVGVAAVTGTYTGVVAIEEQEPPVRYRLRVEGQGRPGFVRGDSLVTLTAAEGSTRVSIRGEVEIGGAIARVGQRLLGSVAEMLLDHFFRCLQTKLHEASREPGARADLDTPPPR